VKNVLCSANDGMFRINNQRFTTFTGNVQAGKAYVQTRKGDVQD
jgi:hypothetical protein